MHLSTSFVFKDSDHAAALFNMERAGHVYSRISNPTNGVLGERIAALEGGVAGIAAAGLIGAIAGAQVSTINDCAHQLMGEKPDACWMRCSYSQGTFSLHKPTHRNTVAKLCVLPQCRLI